MRPGCEAGGLQCCHSCVVQRRRAQHRGSLLEVHGAGGRGRSSAFVDCGGQRHRSAQWGILRAGIDPCRGRCSASSRIDHSNHRCSLRRCTFGINHGQHHCGGSLRVWPSRCLGHGDRITIRIEGAIIDACIGTATQRRGGYSHIMHQRIGYMVVVAIEGARRQLQRVRLACACATYITDYNCICCP